MPVMTASSLFFGKASIGLRRSRGAGAHRRALLRPLAMRVPTPLPGEWSGPGSGHRHFPEDHEEEQADATARTSFDCKTTAQCYEEFPYLVHVSVPLKVEDHEPAGLSSLHVPDAGPATGHRRPPPVADVDAREHPPALPHPAEQKKDLKKEVQLRHEILC